MAYGEISFRGSIERRLGVKNWNLAYLLQSLNQGWGAGKFFSGSGSWLFFQAAPAPDFFSQAAPAPGFFSSGSGSKEPKTPGSDQLRLRLLTIG